MLPGGGGHQLPKRSLEGGDRKLATGLGKMNVNDLEKSSQWSGENKGTLE